MQYIKTKNLTQKKQVLCGLRGIFLLFSCQTPVTKNEFILRISEHEQYLNALSNHNPSLAMEILDQHMIHTFDDFRWISDEFPQYINQKKKN